MKKIAVDFGKVEPPEAVKEFDAGGDLTGLQVLLDIVLGTLIMGAAIYAVINLILAGLWYIGGSGDSKRIWEANNKIWHSILGLVIAAGSFVIAGVLGQVLFGDATALTTIKYFTPN